MKKFLPILKKCPLFLDMQEQEIEKALCCICTGKKIYKKNQYIYNIGDKVSLLPLVVQGAILIEKEDFLGNKTILYKILQNDIFGAPYYYDSEPLPFNVLSSEDSTVIFLDIKKAFSIDYHCCALNNKIRKNFIDIMLKKNKLLNKKIEHISQRSIRNKILSYLSEEKFKNGSSCFYIGFNRQQLADYLCVDRSALSNELSKMQNENIIKFNKNYFELNKNFSSLDY